MINGCLCAIKEHDTYAIHESINSVKEAWRKLIALYRFPFIREGRFAGDCLVCDGVEDIHILYSVWLVAV